MVHTTGLAGGFDYTITTACSNNQHAVLLFLVFAEIHPLPKGALAFTVAFIQVQVTVRTIKLVDFPHCLAKLSVNFLSGSFQKCASGQNLSFFAMGNNLHKEICFIQDILSPLVEISCKHRVVFSRKLVYFFFVPRVVCKSLSSHVRDLSYP